MSKIMLALGKYRFSIDTAAYQELKRTDSYGWAKQGRHASGPARQSVNGNDDSTISLSGTILPHYKGGLSQLPAMRTEAELKQPLIMVSGVGGVLGKWVITSIEETTSNFIQEGAPLKIEFRMELAIYGEDV